MMLSHDNPLTGNDGSAPYDGESLVIVFVSTLGVSIFDISILRKSGTGGLVLGFT